MLMRASKTLSIVVAVLILPLISSNAVEAVGAENGHTKQDCPKGFCMALGRVSEHCSEDRYVVKPI
jgi:hypothetical protein